jgi:hypothetical protein
MKFIAETKGPEGKSKPKRTGRRVKHILMIVCSIHLRQTVLTMLVASQPITDQIYICIFMLSYSLKLLSALLKLKELLNCLTLKKKAL